MYYCTLYRIADADDKHQCRLQREEVSTPTFTITASSLSHFHSRDKGAPDSQKPIHRPPPYCPTLAGRNRRGENRGASAHIAIYRHADFTKPYLSSLV